MLHPSYAELIEKVNSDVEMGEEPVVNSRYSIVMATAKRARQIIASRQKQNMSGTEKEKEKEKDKDKEKLNLPKPLSAAVDELDKGIISILPYDAETADSAILDFSDGEDITEE